MLSRLYIRNIGLIEECDVDFRTGFTVITGETGAGKSMFIDALSLALGARGGSQLIRQGCESAMVEAVFDLSGDVSLKESLVDNGIVVDDTDLVLRRIISPEKSRIFVNGATVTLGQLREFGENLVDIHGQYDHQQLLKSTCHGDMLDHFGHLKKESAAVRNFYTEWLDVYNLLSEKRMAARSREGETALLKDYVDEIQTLDPQEDEVNTLQEERTRLMHGESLVTALQTALNALTENGDASTRVSQAESALAPIAGNVGGEVEELYNRLSSISLELADATQELQHIGSTFEPDPQRLSYVDERLFALKDCAKKHNITVEELANYAQTLQERLQGLEGIGEDVAALEKESAEKRASFEKACAVLTAKREKAAQKLSDEIEKALMHLEMKGARFEVAFNTLEPENYTANGAEKIEFMVSTNAGSQMAPLVKVASGGEVSRLMLALKQVFYASMPSTTLVFDEVDTGVGGSVADAMGGAMQDLSKHHQVFSITHLPQVAAKGDVHVKIEKTQMEKQTNTSLSLLDSQKRQDEIARMLAGKEVTSEAQAAAKRLLEN